MQTVEYGRATEILRLSSKFGRDIPHVQQLLKFWKPDGCIVERNFGLVELAPRDFGRVPTVFLEAHPSLMPAGAACVYCNGEAVATCAAKELLSLGFEHYGFVPYTIERTSRSHGGNRKSHEEIYWSRERREAFEKLVRMNGRDIQCYPGRMTGEFHAKPDPALVKWLTALPKPCGILAANDAVARNVICACRAADIAIPDDLALLGVDDWPELCENTEPTLSSIRTDNESSGRIAAELLADMMGKDLKKTSSRTFGVVGLTRRRSTMRRLGADPRVLKAVEYIRCHACEGITPPDVFMEMECSRSLANVLFRRDMGHTILDEIHAVRLEKVKELLTRTDRDVAAIPDFCGYASLADLRRVFKQRVGCTLGAYRDEGKPT